MNSRRLVVVGHGMAGVRVVEEIRARADPERIAMTVLGGEPHAAYNRVLLPEVLAGRHTAAAIGLTSDQWAERMAVDLRLATPAVALDPVRRVVRAADGDVIGYDALILATGSRPWIPPVKGLAGADGLLVPGAVPFHTIEDCQAAAEAGGSARRAIVLGGGVLGLETACALAGQGLPVELVHDASHLMDRQLDPAAGQVLRRTLSRLGVDVRVGARAAAVETGRDGRLRALHLTDGTRLDADLLVVACGVRPEVSIAAEADLAVGRGVIVDDALRSVSHPDIYAIGECAEHQGCVYGLVGPAWEQAAIAAAQVTGDDPADRYTGSRTVTRLKAAGIDLAAMGETAHDGEAENECAEGCEVLRFADPARGTYKKLIIRDGRVAGAILVGDIGTVGTLTQLYDRGADAPADRLSLLFTGCRAAAGAGDDPAAISAAATICQCNGVSKAQIQASVLAGRRSVAEVAAATRATTGCGSCRPAVAGLLDWLSAAHPAQPPQGTGQEVRV